MGKGGHGLEDEALERQKAPLLRVDQLVAEPGHHVRVEQVEAGAARERADPRRHDANFFDELFDER